MSFSMGIVGLPNVGKSTLFKALTKKQIDIANYPFCTIEPNKGIVEVPDERLEKLAQMSRSEKMIFTTIEFVDIAGLVKGASRGEGLGNKFLSHIREVDAIVQVLRNFHNGDITHVDGKIDPAHDMEVINTELALADLESVSAHLEKLQKKIKGLKGKELDNLQKTIELLEKKIMPNLEQGEVLRKVELSDEEKKSLAYLNLLTLKPMIYILNVDENKISEPINLPSLKDEIIIPVCAKLEAEFAELSKKEVEEYLNELQITRTGLDRIISESYKLLNLISFLTTGPKESRAWTIELGTKAPQAAGRIHGDFEKGFIAVDVINWQDLLIAGSEVTAKEKGLIRIEGKNYIMQDGDVCNFKFNV